MPSCSRKYPVAVLSDPGKPTEPLDISGCDPALLIQQLEMMLTIRYAEDQISDWATDGSARRLPVRQTCAVGEPALLEAQYDLLDRSIEDDILPTASHLSLGVTAYGALARGLLTGKYSRDSRFPENDRRHRLAHFSDAAWKVNSDVIERLRLVSESCRRSMSQVAIRWVLDHPAVDCIVIGAKNTMQIDSNVDILNWSLTDGDRAMLAPVRRSCTPTCNDNE